MKTKSLGKIKPRNTDLDLWVKPGNKRRSRLDREQFIKMNGIPPEEYDRMKALPAIELGREMIRVRGELDEASNRKSELEKRYKAVRKVLAQTMESENLEKFTVDGRGINSKVEIFASIPAGKREEAYQWLRDHGLGSLVVETVNASTLKAAVKEEITEGRPLPPELFKVTVEEWAGFYSGGSKKD